MGWQRNSGQRVVAPRGTHTTVPNKSQASPKQVRKSLKSKTIVPPPDLQPQAEAEAEACFHKAIEIAHRQGTKSLELRAVMSLSGLWQRQGKKKHARTLLADIDGWFTEGFDTADLQEAKALLGELT